MRQEDLWDIDGKGGHVECSRAGGVVRLEDLDRESSQGIPLSGERCDR